MTSTLSESVPGQLDINDLVAYIGLPFFLGILFKIFDVSVNLLDVGFQDVLFTLGSFEITIAYAASIGLFAWVLSTNGLDLDQYEDFEKGLIIIGGALIALMVVPDISSTILGNEAIQVGSWLIALATPIYISYTA